MWSTLARAIARFDFATAQRWGSRLGTIAGSLFRIRRPHVCTAMRRAGLTDPDRFYRALGTSAFEFLWIAGRKEASHVVVVPDGAARVAEILQTSGAVIAATHTGNWDLTACAVAARFPLTIVTKRLSNRALDAFWQSSRKGFGVDLIDGGPGALRAATLRIRDRRLVAMMIDQVPSRRTHAIRGEFLSEAAWLDKSPALLAYQAQVPLITVAGWRMDDGSHRVEVLHVDDPRGAKTRWIEAATLRANAELEAFVRKHPSEWLWLHRRWKAINEGDSFALPSAPAST